MFYYGQPQTFESHSHYVHVLDTLFRASDELQVKAESAQGNIRTHMDDAKLNGTNQDNAQEIMYTQATLNGLYKHLISLHKEYLSVCVYADRRDGRITKHAIITMRLSTTLDIIGQTYRESTDYLVALGLNGNGHATEPTYRLIKFISVADSYLEFYRDRFADTMIPPPEPEFLSKQLESVLALIREGRRLAPYYTGDVIECIQGYTLQLYELKQTMTEKINLRLESDKAKAWGEVEDTIKRKNNLVQRNKHVYNLYKSNIVSLQEARTMMGHNRNLPPQKDNPVMQVSADVKVKAKANISRNRVIEVALMLIGVFVASILGASLFFTSTSVIKILAFIVFAILVIRLLFYPEARQRHAELLMYITGVQRIQPKQSAIDPEEELKGKRERLSQPAPHVLKIGNQTFTSVNEIEMPYGDNSVIYVDGQTWIKGDNGDYELVVDDMGENDVDANIRYVPPANV